MRNLKPLSLSALVLALVLALGLSLPGVAFAHALLVKAVPAVGGRVASSPAEIRITYSEAVEARFSGIELKGANGDAIATGPASIDPKDRATLVVPVKAALPPGSYKVNWHVVSVDTHKTQGSFTFEVKP
jgi:methionine-rich copper-binding protein CopC